SAGGHLVALLGTNEKYLKAEGCSLSDIRGVIPMSGVYLVSEKFMPDVFGTDKDEAKAGSPLMQGHANLPPYLVLWAENDFPTCGKVPSELFAGALKKEKNTVETCEFKDTNHMTIIMIAANPDNAVSKKIQAFVNDNAK